MGRGKPVSGAADRNNLQLLTHRKGRKMKTKVTAAVIALMLAPTAIWAMCSAEEHASSCKEGYVLDQTKGECVVKPTT